MKRLTFIVAAAAAALYVRPALADDADTAAGSPKAAAHAQVGDGQIDADAHEAADDALADKAEPPSHQPKTLPTTASERAHEVAFGKQGEAERLAHSQAGKHGREDADHAHADAANRAAHGAAASAAGSANADAHSGADHAATGKARSGGAGGAPMGRH